MFENNQNALLRGKLYFCSVFSLLKFVGNSDLKYLFCFRSIFVEVDLQLVQIP